MNKRFFSLIISCFIFGWFVTADAQQKPNILFIIADDLGYGDLSSYGAKDLASPRIDSLLKAGVRYTQFYANCTVCSPSRAAILTGRYPVLVGVPGVIRSTDSRSFGFLNPGAITLPQVLKKGGYQTAIVGKWHLGLASPDLPNERGFDYFHGFLGDMMDDYYTHLRLGANLMRQNNAEINPPQIHATELFAQWAVDYLKSRVSQTQPFFLYLAFNAPHDPIQPPQQFLDAVLARQPGIAATRAKIVALIEHLDFCVGGVLDTLQALGFSNNTLVIFNSDNGGQLSTGASNTPLSGGKGDMFEGGIRVPMGARWPGKIPAGTVSDRVAMGMDLFPLLCGAAGIEYNHETEGRSFLPALLGQEQPEENRYLFWVRRGDKTPPPDSPYFAARRGTDKILQNTPLQSLQLYNLQSDPQEKTNIGQNNATFLDLNNALQGHLKEAAAIGWVPGTPAYVPRTITLNSPVGGETWVSGSQHDISWKTTGAIANVNLEYQFNNGSWISLGDSLPSPDSTGTYKWKMPAAVNGALLLRISALQGDVRDLIDAAITVSPTAIKYAPLQNTQEESRLFLYGRGQFLRIPVLFISIELFNIEGTLIKKFNNTGSDIFWDGRDNRGQVMPKSMYMIRLYNQGGYSIKKAVFIR